MRPPRGACDFMILMASCVHRNMPVRLMSTTFFQVSSGSSSSGMAGAPIPALLNRTSRSPNVSLDLAHAALTDAGSPAQRLERLMRYPDGPASWPQDQGSGIRSQESGVRSQESGVRSQESGVRNPSFGTIFISSGMIVGHGPPCQE